jgi:hypothetical protein
MYNTSCATWYTNITHAEVVESVDTRDLKSLAFGRAGSIPALGTFLKRLHTYEVFFLS